MEIENYKFGEVVIDGKSYTNDLKIIENKIKTDWWREKGHLLQVKDLEDVHNAKPDRLIVGTGADGMMNIDNKVREKSKDLGIELIEEKTAKACKLYNQEKDKEKIALAIHLTC